MCPENDLWGMFILRKGEIYGCNQLTKTTVDILASWRYIYQINHACRISVSSGKAGYSMEKVKKMTKYGVLVLLLCVFFASFGSRFVQAQEKNYKNLRLETEYRDLSIPLT